MSVKNINTANGASRLAYFDMSPFFIPKEGTTSYDLSQLKLLTLADGKVQVVYNDGNVVEDGQIKLRKEDTPATRAASMHVNGMDYLNIAADGANVGLNDKQTVAPGATASYRWYAGRIDVSPDGVRTATPIEYGAINLTDYGDIMKHGSHGAVGMIVIKPRGATWTMPSHANLEATVNDAAGNLLFKEFNVLYQDDLVMKAPNGSPVRNYTGDEDSEDAGIKGFNYKTEPIWARLGFMAEMSKIDHMTFQDVSELLNDVNQANVLSSMTHGDPETPVFSAAAGTPVRFRVVQPTGHPRQHAFTVLGHSWFHEAWVNNSTVLWRPNVDPEPDSMNIGSQGGYSARRHWNVILPSAGGGFSQAGDYLMRTQESFHFTSGLWGIFRVTPSSSTADRSCLSCIPPDPSLEN